MSVFIKNIKTPYDRAEKAGKEILNKARDEQSKRKKWADNEIGQASKEAATYLAGCARGRVSVTINPKDWERIFHAA